MTILLRLPDTTPVSTLERALNLLGLRLSQTVERRTDGDTVYTAERQARQIDAHCEACAADGRIVRGQLLVGRRNFCPDHWHAAYLEVERGQIGVEAWDPNS
jgi:hypothetical protein